MYASLNPESTTFTGHESFTLRYSWLTKGYDQLVDDPAFFAREDAALNMGVGHHMVRAIRYWGVSCAVWRSVPGKGVEYAPTALGNHLLREGGWDRYLEKPASLWVLHWHMARALDSATTVSWIFANPRPNRFDRDQLVQELVQLARETGGRSRSATTIRKDVDVILRTYCPPRDRHGAILEDALMCPMTALGLMRRTDEKGVFELVQGPHPSLPLYVFEYALLDYVRGRASRPGTEPGQFVVSLDELLYGTSSPGRIFRLGPEGLIERLNTLVSTFPERYLFDETAGLRQLMTRGQLPGGFDVLEQGFRRAYA